MVDDQARWINKTKHIIGNEIQEASLAVKTEKDGEPPYTESQRNRRKIQK